MSKDDFFAVGKPKAPTVEYDFEEQKNWKDIKPQQQLDAVNKNTFKKRKYDEFKQKKAKIAEMPKKADGQQRTLPFQQKRIKKNTDQTRKLTPLSEQYRQKQQSVKEKQSILQQSSKTNH